MALLHGAAERDALLELIDDVLADQARVELGKFDLDDVHLELAGEASRGYVRISSMPTPRLPMMIPGLPVLHDHARLIGTALDLDFRDRGRARPAAEILANRDVFVQPRHVVLFLEPAAVPRPRDAQSKSDRMDLLSHVIPWLPQRLLQPARSRVCAEFFLLRVPVSAAGAAHDTTRALHRGTGAFARRLGRRLFAHDDRHVRQALTLEVRAALRARIQSLGEASTGPPSTVMRVMYKSSAIHVVIVARVGDGTAHQLADRLGGEHVGELAATRVLRARTYREWHRRRGAICAVPCGRNADARRRWTWRANVRQSLFHRRLIAAVSAEDGASAKTRRACGRPYFR